ncbi:probable ATP-dependent DNA helicase HFM1 [Teleopsis dalmanni]|uniref:probable ATP-dependent DNA helicase HFM1 n=1 Tax=Teleopsis dalmanni TaxID=139649 RepID=UPI0018CEC751|nr:probable ATP-dependent DNA helicase HFM1 [Teleopsis dalmanni]
MQQKCINDLLNSENSIVLSAPTGSGKTVAFELAIIRLLHQQSQQIKFGESISAKAVYVAPIKALCAEKFIDWKKRFEVINVVCTQITGDSNIFNVSVIRDSQVIVTTPEKWDSITRHWREYIDIVSAVRVLMVDEVHLLSEDVRGPVLEAIISRMKTIADIAKTNVRIIVASATIPNVEDLACWIGGYKNENVTKLVYVF